jgi:hypothetical protein
MQLRKLVFACVLVACGGGPDPRVIKGGGIGDGAIDGTLNVYVIDHDTEQAVTGATVEVGNTQKTTDKNGLVVFNDVHGAQTIAVSAAGYRGTVWMQANGGNVTIAATKLGTPTPAQATLSGSINNWSTITVPAGHVKAALIIYSQTDRVGDAANNIATPNNGNVCGVATPNMCNWTINTRTGAVTLLAEIVDIDGTTQAQTVIGWAMKTGLQVDSNINQSGIALDLVDAGNVETVTIDYGTPPAALTNHQAVVGYELAAGEIAQGVVDPPGSTTLLVPKPTVFAPSTTRRLVALAQTTTMPPVASVVLQHGITGTTLSAGTWLDPPTSVTMTHSNASFGVVSGAIAHTAQWSDANGPILEITCFDDKTSSFDVPSLVALPTTGTLTGQVSAIRASFSVTDFSLDADADKLTGDSVQPAAAVN